MTQPVYLLIGAAGSGKTWVARQVLDKFTYVPHDQHYDEQVPEVIKAARISKKPVLTDTPFSIKTIMEPLKRYGIEVKPVFIIESYDVTKGRYEKREGKPVPKGHMKRLATYRQRAFELRAPFGTSSEILEFLRRV